MKGYGAVVFRWCRRFGLPKHDALSVTQDILHTLKRHLPKYRQYPDREELKHWLLLVTQHRVRKFARMYRDRELALGSSTWQDVLSRLYNRDGTINTNDSCRPSSRFVDLLASVQAEFSQRDWNIFVQTAVHGAPGHLVADELGITVKLVYLARSRILKRLRHLFPNEIGD